MKSKKIVLISLLIISIILTSCTGSREVDNLGIVINAAIDIVDEKPMLTHEVIVPKSNLASGKADEPNVKYVQSTGKTIFDATRNATLTFDRRIFMSHNGVFIIGEEFAKRGIADLLNFYISDNEPRESAVIIVAKGSKAYEIMGINAGLSDIPGRYISYLLENSRFNMMSRRFTFSQYMRYYLDDNNVVLPIVEKVTQLEFNKEENPIKDALDVTGGAVFRKDKLIGYYNGDEMKGFNFIVNEFENALIVFETDDELVKDNEYIGTKGKYTTVEVMNSKTKNKVELIDGKLHLIIDVKVEGSMIDDTKGLDISHMETLEAIKLACSNKVKDYITMTMDKAQKEFKVDSFSIGNWVHIKYPKLWREISGEWENIFPDLAYEVNVETDFIRTGLLNTPVNIRVKENRLKENK